MGGVMHLLCAEKVPLVEKQTNNEEEKYILIVKMIHKDNRISPIFVNEFNKILNEYENDRSICGLITIGNGKFYSNGLDIVYLYKNENKDSHRLFPDYFYPLLARIMTLPFTTVAAINGHAYAGGMALAMSHDYRVMLTSGDGGGPVKLCMNEIALKSPIPPAMVSLLKTKITNKRILGDLLLSAVPFDAKNALNYSLVDNVVETPNELLLVASKLVEKYTKYACKATGLIKGEMYKETLTELSSKTDIHVEPLFVTLRGKL